MPSIDDVLGPPPMTTDPDVAAKRNGLDPKLFKALVQTESSGNNNAVSSKGAVGKGQSMPSTAANPGYGVRPFNPKDLDGNAAYLKKLIDLSGGDVTKALRMYKQGPNGTLDTKSADAYVNSILTQWKPAAETLLGPRPKDPDAQSPIAKSPQAIDKPAGQQQQQEPPKPLNTKEGIMDAINKPADRTVELMKESTQDTWKSIQELAKHPGVKNATMAALNVIGLPFSPVSAAAQAFIGDPVKGAAHQMGMPQGGVGDKLLDTVSQLAVPVAATRSAVMQAAMGPAGKFLLGVADTYSERIAAGQGAGVVSAELTGLQGKAEASKAQWLDTIRKIVPDNYKQMAPEIAHNIETGGAHPLTTEAAQFKAQYLDPALKQTEQMATALTGLTGQKPKWLANYYPRNVTEESRKGTPLPGVVDVRVPQDAKALKTSPGELQERSAGGAHDPNTGEDAAYVKDAATGKILIMKNRNVIGQATSIEHGELVDAKGNPTGWHANDGTMRDIEQHTNLSYTKDPIADIAKAHSDVFTALANAQAVERLKVTPEFLSQARRPGQKPPADTWVKVDNMNIGTHQLDDWHVSPRIAEVLKDFQRNQLSDGIQGLSNLNRAIVGSLFLNPLAHIMNVAWHSWVEKGLVSQGSVAGAAIGGAVGGVHGAVAGAAIGSMVGSATEMKSLMTAMKAVATRDDNYMRYLKDGAGLMYASRFTRDFFNKALQATGTQATPSMLSSFGVNTPKDLIASVYRGAGNVMWGTNDVIMMQSYLANESRLAKGRLANMPVAQQQRQAMTDTEKHVPNYNVPSRIGPTALETIPGGATIRRGMAELMQGKAGILRFPRYDYGRIASYINMMRDTIAGLHGAVAGDNKIRSAQDAMTGMNQVAALGFGAFVMYPMLLDKVAQTVTGNKNASWQRYGPFTVPSLLYNYMTGKADWENIAASMLPLGPIAMTATEQIYNRDLFTGKSLNLPQGEFNFLLGQFSPVQDLQRIQEGKVQPKQWLVQQFGIKSPTEAQVAKAKKFFEQEQHAHDKWLKEHQ